MLIPKQFEGLHDLEAMLLTSILGTFVSLKEGLISIQQAESYWLSDLTAELFEEMKLSSEVIELLQEGIKLKEIVKDSEKFKQKIDDLIEKSKQLIGRYYTEYDSDTIEIESIIN